MRHSIVFAISAVVIAISLGPINEARGQTSPNWDRFPAVAPTSNPTDSTFARLASGSAQTLRVL